MHRAGILLGLEIMSAQTEDDLNEMLYNRSSGAPLRSPVIWVIWKPKENNIWTLSIRSTERARFVTSSENRETSNPHLRAGFLAVQLAISQAIIEHSSIEIPDFEVTLVSMPVSPLMEEGAVRQALSAILLCFTLALIPPVLETEALVVNETVNSFKRALRLRNVGYATMYVSWLVYAYLTCLPICVLASITLILIFRWIHLFAALLVVMAYASVMIMLALMMGMFHSKDESISPETSSLVYMVMSWCIMNIFYFGVLMMLQRTIGQKRAIGGQVSWSSIIFKKVEVGLTFADHGTITVLGERLEHGTVVMTSPHMMGYCHHSETLIEDLTVQEHFTLFSMVIVIPALTDHRTYVSVIKDKIMQYKKYKTIVSLNFSSMQIEYADRIFVFDSKILVFGGTPAYMFFKYGREYRVRMTMKSGISDDTIKELLNRAEQAGATVRAHLGSLLILRLPASPTATVAELVKDLTDNSNKYGLTSFNISVADSEEVCRRAIMDSRLHVAEFEGHTSKRSKRALSKIMGFSLSSVLFHMDPGRGSKKVISGEMQILSVESLEIYTTLVLRADNSSASQSIAHGYVLSDTKATQNEIENIEYTSLPHTESLTEYLVTRAIDSPQVYVYMYAYGMDVSTDANGTVNVMAERCDYTTAVHTIYVDTDHFSYYSSTIQGIWTYQAYSIIVPFMLTVYGIGCVPQAYIFSLGPRMALNTMTFVIVNLVFGETTILAKIFYGDVFSYAVDFMSLSPQFNMAYAFVKIKQIFLYNSECVIFKARNLCPMNTFHKCCEKCGVLQDCFSTKSYFTRYPGVMMEVIATCTTAVFFTIILLLIEYRIFYRLWNYGTAKLGNRDKPAFIPLTPGSQREQNDVIEKKQQIKKHKHNEKVDTFGDYILASNVAKRIGNFYAVHNLFLGIGRGEALALSGLKAHGRTTLGEILAGYTTPDVGNVWAMSKYKLRTQPHKYSQQVSVSCDRDLLPSWMGVSSALELIAALRGVPRKFIKGEVKNYIKALELEKLANQYVEDIHANDRTRIHFAAAVIGAPPTIVLDECTAYQDHSVRRAMYSILNALRKRGHAIFISSSSIESHMPVTNKLAIMLDGHIYDVDSVDNMVERYSKKGYTVVVHLKDEVDVTQMFSRYFVNFVINDTTEVLVNIQVLDTELTWAGIFEKMEALKADNQEVYSYIVTVIPIDYIYNTIINKSSGNYRATGLCSWKWFKKLMSVKPEIVPKKRALKKLIPFEQKYDITKLTELPWSVIFHR
ncbi:hypothetical protein HF086_013183 [Spodoptera exigua]|uniref:ABC transporter domain-containing protein n=1 Tax=Spodoptera exigua TaxID=7107 RepID=A0A922MB73_SPOEX|nr:hypothetical protein HF086_013183 [Spodoptera exigua]